MRVRRRECSGRGERFATGRDRNHRRQRAVLHAGTYRHTGRSGSARPSAILRTRLCWARWKAARLRFWRGMGGDTGCCRSELNFRANIFAMKKLGVERIISVSAVGSLKEEHKPTDFVVPDQFIDRTFHRVSARSLATGLWGMWRLAIRSARRWRRRLPSAATLVGVVGKPRRHLCLHGRAAVLHARRVEPVSQLGC